MATDDAATGGDEVNKMLVVEFERYVVNAALLMLNGVSKDLDIALAKDSTKSMIENFVTGQETTLVLEQTILASEDDSGASHQAESKSAESGQDSATVGGSVGGSHGSSGAPSGVGGRVTARTSGVYEFHSEVPSDAMTREDSNQCYLMFIKVADRNLVDTMPISNQVIVSQINPKLPFQTMIPFIRHSFVPVAQMAVSVEEEQINKENGDASGKSKLSKIARVGGKGDGGDDANSDIKSRGILEKLRELELKLAESQDETKLPEVTLEAIPAVQKWLETLTDDEKAAIIKNNQFDNEKIPAELKEASTLNSIQKNMKDWKEEILFVVRKKKPMTSTVQQEIKFWKAKEIAITRIENQLNDVSVIASTMILFQNNYTVQARAFTNRGQLNDAKKEIESHNKVLSTFPLSSLHRATNIQEIIGAIGEIFQHLDANKNSQPLERIADLARAAARDVGDQLREVISKDVMVMRYGEFEHRTNNSDRLFRDFNNKYTKLRSDLRQRKLLQNRSYASSSWTRDSQETDLNRLQKRLNDIKAIRKGHSIISKVIESTFSAEDKGLLENERRKIEEAYDVFRKIEVLRCSDFDWAKAVETYESRIQDVENEIQQMVRKAMEEAKDPREMFRVCEKFNKLFVRDRIRAAVWDFSSELLDNIEREVKELQGRYRQRYENIPASRLSQLRDIPQVSGQVIWCRQLKRQLDQHVRRVEAVLGPQWNLRMNGKDLAERITSFSAKLDPMILVKKWEEEAKTYPNFDDKIPIFRIDKGVGKSLSLNVNFDENYVKLFKEVRCLIQLGVRIDIGLRLSCIDVKQKYPIAVKLKDAVSIYQRSCKEMEHYSGHSSDDMMQFLSMLIDHYKSKVQQNLLDGYKFQWVNHERQLNGYVALLSQSAIDLQDKQQKAFDLTLQADKTLDELKTCTLVSSELEAKLRLLQDIIHQLDDGNFYGVTQWCNELNKRLETILLGRVDEVLNGYKETLEFDWPIGDAREFNIKQVYPKLAKNQFCRSEAVKHTIRISPNSRLLVEPPIAQAKLVLMQDLQDYLAMLANLHRPSSDHDESDVDNERSFKGILGSINTDKIVECYAHIEKVANEAAQFVKEWLSYQALWDMKMSSVFETLGDDIGKWRQLLKDMKDSQSSFDPSMSEKAFGPIIVNFGSVSNKVETKYREFRKQTLHALASRLGQLLRDFLAEATRGKHELEETDFTSLSGSTEAIVKAVTQIQELKDVSSTWDQQWENCKEAEAMLKNNRMNLGPTWVYASRIRGVLDDFFALLDKRWQSLLTEATSIYGKLEEQLGNIGDNVKELENRWHAEKPTQGWASTWTEDEVVDWLRDYQGGLLRPLIENFRTHFIDGSELYKIAKKEGSLKASTIARKLEITDAADQEKLLDALSTLLFTHKDVNAKMQEFEKVIEETNKQFQQINTAKAAMRVVVDSGGGTEDEDAVKGTLESILKELEGLKEVHRALTEKWGELQQIGQQKFLEIDSRELGKTLRAVEDELNKLPTKMKTYQVFNKFMDILKEKKRMNKNLLGDLAAGGLENPILRPKHWAQVFKILNIRNKTANALLLEDLWSLNLMRYITEVREILTTAQGENALENFLSELTEKWNQTFYELVDFKGKCSLVKNWNDLMADVADALSDVMSMKQSPFYKAFERQAVVWEQKLNMAQAIFDSQIDVQRRWVYLQGVFSNSADVQKQLGYMFSKFKGFNREFVTLMKGIKEDPLVDHWVTEEKGLLPKLEANQQLLNQIQKALNEYLESQRAAFARFYFVGDDDLLEIIGNATDPVQMNKHLAKMFAGITQLVLSPSDAQVVIGMVSREGEKVLFKEVVDVKAKPRIQDWLTGVEYQMRFALASLLEEALATAASPEKPSEYFDWVGRYPAQVMLLATQVSWSEQIETNLKRLSSDQSDESHQQMVILLNRILQTLTILANEVLKDVEPSLRLMYEQLITELVYQRDMTRNLIKDRICSETDFAWLYRMRFYWNRSEKDVLKKLEIRISRAKFYYGFEYFGATEKLVQTPLTDKAYLTLCEALHAKMGGNPFGPAGTGKTESVKALGAQLGRFVLVFCCDETFDYNAMSRIFIGLCQCGAWGCFDEFNRLEEVILSAVSQQILTIQTGLREESDIIKIRGENVRLNPNMGVFVTMNPGYAGRSELPDNLKQLFRGMAMVKPDRVLIAQVMLFSQGFGNAEELSSKIVLLFELCSDQLSKQSHYDFGLRALKSVLRSAGNVKRSVQKEITEAAMGGAPAGGGSGDDTAVTTGGTGDDDGKDDEKAQVAAPTTGGGGGDEKIIQMSATMEETILIRSLMSTVVPKLVMNDKFLFDSLMESAFPGADVQGIKEKELEKAILDVARERYLEVDDVWLVKLMQFYTIQNITHGVMLVGPSGTGKSAARNVLLEAMERVDGVKSEQYEIDPKAINKEQLYGILDPTTLEWTDGVFTATLRMIIDNVRGESNKRHWIVFDGDVDPEWAENLNSVLDDNKMLTLPNGERLSLTPNIRIIFETPNLNYATPATVSRCGMVWFSTECVTLPMLFSNQLNKLKFEQIKSTNMGDMRGQYKDWETVQTTVADYLKPIFEDKSGLVFKAMEWAETKKHVMTFTRTRATWSLFSQLRGGITNILEYNDNNEVGLTDEQIQSYFGKYLLFAMTWAFGGPMGLELRSQFGNELCNMAGVMDVGIEVPDTSDLSLLDYEVVIDTQQWKPWKDKLSNPELEPHKIRDPTVVINTIDTTRHEEVIRSWLADNRPVILCGPPGSGKSMTLSAVLRANPQYEMITLNFSSSAGTDLIFKAFDQYCKIERRNQGHVLRPTFQNKRLVIFCDECNLPAEDLYGTQTIITFIRQIIEKGGYWHPTNKNWIKLENIQFVGACNPPTDAGRVVLSPRFLNHCPLILVDFPGRESLLEIYGSFVRALVKLTPEIRNMGDTLTTAMVDVYQRSQKRFNTDIQAHYVYSPRELSRWTRAMYRALADLDDVASTTAEEIVRLWAHEALRLFSDRLVTVAERKWTLEMIEEVAKDCFNGTDLNKALEQPILYSDYLSKNYVSVDKDALKDYIMQRLKVFNEEELDVQLVIYNELLDHILRIDRVLRQPLGHLLMVGASGAGKTVFSRFVSWMNGMSTFQIKVHKDYSAEDFDMDLRGVLIQSGVEHQKITFIFDESNILDTAFLERMNALLASGEVPGLFEDADYQQLIMKLREAARKDGLLIDTEEELYQMFTRNVQNNLHIVFTMNPAGGDFSGRAATSPALFNRCVINWWGTWSEDALMQVAKEFTESCDLLIGVPKEMREADEKAMEAAENDPNNENKPISGVHMSVATSLVQFHGLVHKVMQYLAKNMYRSTFVTPRHYLDLINHFVKLFDEKRLQLEDQQKHLATGLRALKETEEEVARRQVELDAKQKELAEQQQKANETLQQMMESEKDAQKKRAEAIKVEAEVQVEMKSITERSDVVEGELAEAKPALEAAKKAVSGITKRQLDEIRAFKKPPDLVDMTMQAVCILMGKKAPDWKAVKNVIGDAKFVPSILEFDSKKISEKRRDTIKKKFLSNENWTYEKVNNSSKACGPLVQWVISQVKFAHLLDSVEPMQKEIRDLREKLQVKQEQAENLSKMVKELEAKIEEYKQVYETMVQKITELKNEMKIVQDSMARAVKLLGDLSDEKNRWQGETDNFQKQISTLVADCLISAGFLTYIGYYNITYRQILISKWKEILTSNGLPFNENMELTVYLSAPAQRIAWKTAELPEDDLCVENAIILERFNRYPLVVDPSGQATTFLMNNYKSKKIVRTSFLDSAFLKNLESGLRFGNALLIEDVENMDPILNPVLNKEYQTVGGRKLIRLANKDIDFSPSFTMFLVTRDPSSAFAPDLCSRVTFVNFSVTPSSLQSQCLSKILRSEAPDIDKKRNDQLRLQGEFKFQLRELEDQLLNALNSVSGNILDDTKLMGTLETLKLKAKVIAEKAAETEKVLDQIEEASQFYTPFARATSKLYFSLEALARVHFLYQFSLKAFLDIVEYILHTATLPELQALEDASHRESRLVPLVKALHRVTFIRTKRALLVKDHSAFALRVAQVFLECHPDDQFNIKEEVLSFVLKGKGYQEGSEVSAGIATKLELSSMGAQLLGNLYKISGFDPLKNEVEMSLEDWLAYRGGDAEAPIPNNWESGDATLAHQKSLEQLAIQKVFRPDQMIRSARNFVEQVFGWNLYEFEANADSLTTVVQEQIDEETPILMASTPGNDPSSKIEQCASEVFGSSMKSKFQAFAMGSPEDYQKADDAITGACKRGTWVCLKNVHLSPGWLTTLEKRLHRLKKDSAFRLFMTMEIHPKIPVTLLRKSQIVIYEPPLGIKASLQRTFNSVNADRVDRAPEERSRLYILLGWLHAVVLERLRFEPIGWSKAYEFSETDLVCAMAALDEWIDKLANNRDNVDPNEIPWDALHKMLVQFVYGGRVDNKYDTARLTSFVENLLTTEAFNTNFALAARCVKSEEAGASVGRLGFVYPMVNGNKVNREMLARVVQITESGDLKIVFLQKYIVVGKQRINLNATDNWIKSDAFRISDIRMEPAIILPEKTKYVNIKEWALNLDDVKASNPAIIGLPPRAELMILAKRAVEMCGQLLKLQDIETGNAMEELTAMLDNADGADAGGAVPAWMKVLRAQAEKWKEDIPSSMEKLKEKQDSIKNPLFRFMRREFQLGDKILSRMITGLTDLMGFVDGDIKATNELRQLINRLAKEEIPKAWGLYEIDRNLTVTIWILDFVKRIGQFNKIASDDYVSDPKPCLWLGGLFQPEGFIAATRQYIAQINKWPLESLKLYLEIGQSEPVANSFIFDGLILYGAGWSKESGCLVLTEKTQTPLPESRFLWVNGEDEKDPNNYEGQAPDIVSVRIPVYLNSSFKSLLFDINCRVSSSLPPEMWVQRAVSLSVWSN